LRMPRARSLARKLQRNVDEKRQSGLEAAGCNSADFTQPVEIVPATVSLICERRIHEPVAQHELAFGQRWTNDAGDVRRPRGVDQHRLGERVDIDRAIEKNRAYGVSNGRAARLASDHDWPLPTQPLRKTGEQGALAASLNPLNGDEHLSLLIL